VWAPVPDLATVIVVDESDEAFDDERAPTWNARDVAVERARRVGASVRMLTPAPSVEAYVTLGEPAGGAPIRRSGTEPAPRWPRVDVVDVRDQEPGQALLTRELADALHRVVERGERAVCVLNRTGRSRLLACRACRELARCERCGATVAEREDQLVCPVCATARPVVCLHCTATRFRSVKPGVAHVRDDLAALLPRVDVESVEASSRGEPVATVLVGTEAVLHRVAPGGSPADARPFGLVAYLELDQELLAPRVRAAEQALWLVVRGARLLTPRPSPGAGTLLLQTRVPEHEVVVAVADRTPLAVTRAERDRRAALGFPPFGGLAALTGEAVAVEAACVALRASGLTVLGPADGGRRALVRAPTWDALADALVAPAVDAAHTLGRLRVDVDPRRAA
jgi:primosomal protein N' (replication factor Y)